MIDEADSIDPITAYDHTPNEQSVSYDQLRELHHMVRQAH